MTTKLTRAQFLEWTALSGLGSVIGCGSDESHAYPSCPAPDAIAEVGTTRRFEYFHGVASGDPGTDRVVLWTRLTCCVPLDEVETVEIGWEVASDESFVPVLAHGLATTSAERDFTVKVDVLGLPADARLFHRFYDPGAADDRSPIGRTWTLPSGHVARATFAAIACTAYSTGYFNAYRHIALRDDLRFVLHLGDYIYEYGTEYYDDDSLDRRPDPSHELRTLRDYRTRYAQVRSDPDLQAVHAAHPFVAIWDDHEIIDDVWDGGAAGHGSDDRDFATRRAAAIEAYVEWMPVRETIRDGHVSLYREVAIGDLLDILLVDTRLEARDRQGTATAADPTSTLLGDAQERWLFDALSGSSERGDAWRILASPVVVMQLVIPDFSLDLIGWEGYPAVRERLFDHLEAESIRDVVVLSGDFHAAIGAEVARDPFDPALYDPSTGEGTILPEIAVTSATSPAGKRFVRADGPSVVAATHPHVRFFDEHLRGYVVVDVQEDAVVADVLRSRTIRERDPHHTRAVRFTVDRGSPGLRVDG